MPASFNKVIVLGTLTRDPELRYTPQGKAVTDLPLAINRVSGRGNDRREETTYVDVTVWERRAETCCEYLFKGRQVLIEGRLVTESWDDRETGRKRSKLKILAHDVQFIGGKDSNSSGGCSRSGNSRAQDEARNNQQRERGPDLSGMDDGDYGEDVPF